MDYHDARFGDQLKAENPGGVALILAPFAGQSLQGSEPLVSTDTKIILLSPVANPADMKIGPVESQIMVCEADGAALGEVASRFASGELKMEVAQVFTLEQAAEAQQLSATEHVRGKIVIKVSD